MKNFFLKSNNRKDFSSKIGVSAGTIKNKAEAVKELLNIEENDSRVMITATNETTEEVEVKEEAVKETLAETKAEVKAEMKAVEKAAEPATAVTAAEAAPAKKTAARKTAAKKTETKPAEKKAAAVKKTVKKAVTRKTAAKSEPSTEVFIQYHGKQIDEKALLERVMQDCGEDKISVEDLKLYVKPEDNACYYVANGNVAGKVDLY